MNGWTRLLMAVLLAGGLALVGACADERESGMEPLGTETPAAGTGGEVTPTTGYADLDSDIDSFLDGYIEMDNRFSDNQLDFDVENGVVTVRGSVDSSEERDTLLERLRDVPGVRNVMSDELMVSEEKGTAKTPRKR